MRFLARLGRFASLLPLLSPGLPLDIPLRRFEHPYQTMANVVTHPHLQVGFHPGPVGHSPSPLGFGFGLSTTGMVQSWPSAAPHIQPSPWTASPQLSQAPLRAKRRHEPEDEDRDERMDRSPTPERPRRAVPKRARIIPAAISSAGKEQQHNVKENKPPSQSEENDVDVGFLLGKWLGRGVVSSWLIDKQRLSPHSLSYHCSLR